MCARVRTHTHTHVFCDCFLVGFFAAQSMFLGVWKNNHITSKKGKRKKERNEDKGETQRELSIWNWQGIQKCLERDGNDFLYISNIVTLTLSNRCLWHIVIYPFVWKIKNSARLEQSIQSSIFFISHTKDILNTFNSPINYKTITFLYNCSQLLHLGGPFC